MTPTDPSPKNNTVPISKPQLYIYTIWVLTSGWGIGILTERYGWSLTTTLTALLGLSLYATLVWVLSVTYLNN